MELNMNVNERDLAIFGEGYMREKYMGGVRRFERLPYYVLEGLIEDGFADPNETQNYSPCIYEFLMFMKKHPMFMAHGYTVSPYRDDYRVTIEGVRYDGDVMDLDKETIVDFVELARGADELDIRCPYCWWD